MKNDRFNAALAAKGLTKSKLATLLGVSRETVSKWASGESVPRPKMQERLDGLLGLNHGANYALILAGGVGSRVGVGVPKQFVEILGKPVLAYTIEAYQNHSDVDGIEVVCVPSYIKVLRELCEKHGYTKVKWICEGGFDFQHSVMNGVDNLKGQIDDDDIVMVHYGAAPFTSERIITDAIMVAREHGSSVSVTPCFQLLGSNDDGVSSTKWVDRDKYVQLACPQSFKFSYIQDVFARAQKEGLIGKIQPHTTSLMYALGDRLWFSYGDQTNIKITTKEDLDLFEGWALLHYHRQR